MNSDQVHECGEAIRGLETWIKRLNQLVSELPSSVWEEARREGKEEQLKEWITQTPEMPRTILRELEQLRVAVDALPPECPERALICAHVCGWIVQALMAFDAAAAGCAGTDHDDWVRDTLAKYRQVADKVTDQINDELAFSARVHADIEVQVSRLSREFGTTAAQLAGSVTGGPTKGLRRYLRRWRTRRQLVRTLRSGFDPHQLFESFGGLNEAYRALVQSATSLLNKVDPDTLKRFNEEYLRLLAVCEMAPEFAARSAELLLEPGVLPPGARLGDILIAKLDYVLNVFGIPALRRRLRRQKMNFWALYGWFAPVVVIPHAACMWGLLMVARCWAMKMANDLAKL